MQNSIPTQQYALTLLKEMIGPENEFRPGQWEAIESLVVRRERALIVQRTGWGKSIVYFLATKLLRERGEGPTLLISPLLSLMRNQIEMAKKIGIRAFTINSANRDEWSSVENALLKDECDVIFISPEQLNKPYFLNNILLKISGKIGMFVVDEAHCISDWGHDFRPDYRRIVRIIQMLPKNVPVLGTTATANNRVIEDVQTQLGSGIVVYRGTLARESLRLQNIQLANQSERLAWLAENLPKFKGSGIIYCLTVADTKRLTEWLKRKGFAAEAYHAGDDSSNDRPALEQAFLENRIKILVATVALGMGFDKPDIEFVIHFQRPGSVIAYYQQVGRAGRKIDKSYGILLNGEEDDEIQNYFIESAFPSQAVFQNVIRVLESVEEMTTSEMVTKINTSPSVLEKTLTMLEVDGAVSQTGGKPVKYFRTPNPWKPDTERINRVINLRKQELLQIQAYVNHRGCLMEFLTSALDEPSPSKCGRCANCRRKGLPTTVSQNLVIEAGEFIKGNQIIINPRKQLPSGLFPNQKRKIQKDPQNALGRSLCIYGDVGWGKLVRIGKYEQGCFSNDLIEASVRLIVDNWQPEPFPEWVTSIPSRRHPSLVLDFASNLAKKIGITFVPVLKRTGDAQEQKTMQNSFMQARNVSGTLAIDGKIPPTPVLLVDDIIDSGWTMTIAGNLLRMHGSGIVYPFALAKATGRISNG